MHTHSVRDIPKNLRYSYSGKTGPDGEIVKSGVNFGLFGCREPFTFSGREQQHDAGTQDSSVVSRRASQPEAATSSRGEESVDSLTV